MNRTNSTVSEESYFDRQNRLRDWLSMEGIDAAVIEDTEGRRNPALQYLSGMPSDGILFVFAGHPSALTAWDKNLADGLAAADRILAYSDYQRRPETAVSHIISETLAAARPTVELSWATPVPLMERYRTAAGFRFVCRDSGLDAFIDTLRQIKDEEEIRIYRDLAERTDKLIQMLREGAETGRIRTELHAALTIEAESRRDGGEGTGFETIAAGPGRSFAIHAHPGFTDGCFIPSDAPGMGLVDFGIKLRGYTSDVTVPFLTGKLSREQETMVRLVEEACEIAASLAGPGVSAFSIAREITGFFGRNGYSMPHALGHGIGLAAHEPPFIRDREDDTAVLTPGMILTLEPGLYSPGTGGVRLENDFLITNTGTEALTSARTVRLPRQY